MGRLLGKTVLITGGTSGIGLAAARLFRQEGARVAVTGRDPERLAATQAELGPEALVVRSEAGSLTEIDALLKQVGASFGKLDVLFLNAGIPRPAPLEMVSEAQFDEVVNVNLKGVFFTIQKALPLLNPNASIILTTSITNRLGTPNFSVYGATKAALRSLAQSLGLELIGRDIRVNAISPGPIETPIFDKLGLSPDAIRNKKNTMTDKSPIKRFGTPEEIAKVALFLASNDSSFIVGEEIVVDGGMSLL